MFLAECGFYAELCVVIKYCRENQEIIENIRLPNILCIFGATIECKRKLVTIFALENNYYISEKGITSTQT